MKQQTAINFQEMIFRLNAFWAAQGCIIWHPHNVQVGAGTGNPATVLRVLGPEPFNVAYLEPSARPADGRYGENPNRFYEYYQYQVILKPAPEDNICLYLKSLEALGLDWRKHDIRLVEDNWQSPSLGAWGLGWEIWLNGLEITQYTYFQQAAGNSLDPVCIEITYGLERIAMYLQGVQSIPEIAWVGDICYGDLHLADEVDYCKYNFDYADVVRLKQMYDLFEDEARTALAAGLALPAHDYLLKCSHTFNIMDARGSIGVTQRAEYFARMRDVARQVANVYLKQREQAGYVLATRQASHLSVEQRQKTVRRFTAPQTPSDLLFEIGTEELPANDLNMALAQLRLLVPQYLDEAGLAYESFRVLGTPQRLVIYVENLLPQQKAHEHIVRGPAAQFAFDAQNRPTEAAHGFSRSVGVSLDELKLSHLDGKQYLMAHIIETGRSTTDVLPGLLPRLIGDLKFPLMMRWNETQATFSRPIRWLVALYDKALIEFSYAGVETDVTTRGLRSQGQPVITVPEAKSYFDIMHSASIVVDPEERRLIILRQVEALASSVGGVIRTDSDLLDEVINLVEQPYAVLGSFDPEFLRLPVEVLITVMKKHQRYFPVFQEDRQLPYFITITNGGENYADTIRGGNEAVVRARFTDASFFFDLDTRILLADFVPRLNGLSFHIQLGSYLDKTERLKTLMPLLAKQLGYSDEVQASAARLAQILKADLVTNMVIEFTSLQGTIGQYYALYSGESAEIADAIRQHYLPRFTGDDLPHSQVGIVAALADRLDTLVGLFAAGLEPTSSADPYGLRRVALNIVQILAEHELSLPLTDFLQEVASLLPILAHPEQIANVNQFIERRLQSWLSDKGFRPDHIEAVLAVQGKDPALNYRLVRQLYALAQQPEFNQVLHAYKRVAKLAQGQPSTGELIVDHLADPTAYHLYHVYQTVADQILSTNNLKQLIDTLATLTEPINEFFAKVLVMDGNPETRQARLELLHRITVLPSHLLDLTRIVELGIVS